MTIIAMNSVNGDSINIIPEYSEPAVGERRCPLGSEKANAEMRCVVDEGPFGTCPFLEEVQSRGTDFC